MCVTEGNAHTTRLTQSLSFYHSQQRRSTTATIRGLATIWIFVTDRWKPFLEALSGRRWGQVQIKNSRCRWRSSFLSRNLFKFICFRFLRKMDCDILFVCGLWSCHNDQFHSYHFVLTQVVLCKLREAPNSKNNNSSSYWYLLALEALHQLTSSQETNFSI